MIIKFAALIIKSYHLCIYIKQSSLLLFHYWSFLFQFFYLCPQFSNDYLLYFLKHISCLNPTQRLRIHFLHVWKKKYIPGNVRKKNYGEKKILFTHNSKVHKFRWFYLSIRKFPYQTKKIVNEPFLWLMMQTVRHCTHLLAYYFE